MQSGKLSVFFLIITLSFSWLGAQETTPQLKVVAEMANIRLQPNRQNWGMVPGRISNRGRRKSSRVCS